MKSCQKNVFRDFFFITGIVLFLLSSAIPSFAANASYTYDNGNRLIRVNYDDGSKIEYAYDESGNRTIKAITAVDTTAPVTIATPPGGSYDAAQNVTLTCNDGGGTGCDRIYYTTDGSAPMTSSNVYTSAISLAATTTLKFFATDLAGNSESVKARTYTIDAVPPASSISINSGAVATNSVNVTLTLVCGDPQGCSRMQFSNDNVTYSAAETFNTTKAWTLPLVAGIRTVYVKFGDSAGNWSPAVSDAIILDTTAPVTAAATGGGTYAAAQSVTLTCIDAKGAGCDRIYYTTDGTAPTDSSPVYAAPINIAATTTLKYFAKDVAGNSEAVKSQKYTIGATPAAGIIVINAGAVATNSVNVTLTLTCNDPQGCSQMQFSNDNKTYAAAEAFNATKAWTLSSKNGTKKVYVKFMNASGVWSAAYSEAIILDTAVPVTTAVPAGGTYRAAQSAALICNDGSGSGCSIIHYTTDGSTPTASSPVYSAPINIPATTVLKYFAKDIAGNSEAVKSQAYTIDAALPAGTISINSGALATNSVDVTLTLTCSDPQGCTHMKFSNDNSAYALAEAFNAMKTWKLKSGSGHKRVYVKFLNTAGNWSIAYSDSILLDITAPATIPAPAGGMYSTAQSVALTCIDGRSGSGCDKIHYTTDGSTPTASSPVYSAPISIVAATTLKYFATDVAGNIDTVKASEYTIDAAPPAGTVSINSGEAATKNRIVTLTLTCSDPQGCPQMQFSNDNATYSVPEAFSTAKSWKLTTGNGAKTVYVKFINAAGNWSAACSDAILLDASAPVTTAIAPAGYYTAAQSVALICYDSVSGCDRIFYTTDGTTPTTSSPVYTSPISVTTNTMVRYFAADKVGNIEKVRTGVYTIDPAPPVGSVSINSGAAATNSVNVTLALTCSDAPKCTHVQFSNDNATYSKSLTYGAAKSWKLTSGDGGKTVYAKFRDVTGNWSAACSDDILMDTTAPATTASPSGGTYTGAMQVTLSCNDGSGSGCYRIYYTTDGSTPTTSSSVYASPINITATTTVKYFAQDEAGNSEAVKTEGYTIQ